jgi:hypothetical protein
MAQAKLRCGRGEAPGMRLPMGGRGVDAAAAAGTAAAAGIDAPGVPFEGGSSFLAAPPFQDQAPPSQDPPFHP